MPVDGSVASRLAVELALRYAEATNAELALAVLTERRPQVAAYADLSGTHVPTEVRATSDEELQRISIAFRASDIKPNILHLAFDPRSSAVADEVERGHYDLVVVGTENRAIQHRLFFGYENERLIRGTRIPVVVVVPNLSRAGRPQRMSGAPAPRLILIGGGARSGKSRFALTRGRGAGRAPPLRRDRRTLRRRDERPHRAPPRRPRRRPASTRSRSRARCPRRWTPIASTTSSWSTA